MEKIINDRPLNYLIGLGSYFFLIILLLRALGRPSATVCLYLFLAVVALMIGRAAFLLFTRNRPADAAEPSPREAIVRNAAIAIGYWVLIAIVTDGDYVWLVYALIAVIVAMAFAALVFVHKKAGRGTVLGEKETLR